MFGVIEYGINISGGILKLFDVEIEQLISNNGLNSTIIKIELCTQDHFNFNK